MSLLSFLINLLDSGFKTKGVYLFQASLDGSLDAVCSPLLQCKACVVCSAVL